MQTLRNVIEDEEPVGLQVTPLIDIVFLLLVFFILTSALNEIEKELNIALPTAASSESLQRQMREIIINISKEGQITVNRNDLSLQDLSKKLNSLAKYVEGQTVIIRADKKTHHEHVIGVLDVCAEAKMRNISFVTVSLEDK